MTIGTHWSLENEIRCVPVQQRQLPLEIACDCLLPAGHFAEILLEKSQIVPAMSS